VKRVFERNPWTRSHPLGPASLLGPAPEGQRPVATGEASLRAQPVDKVASSRSCFSSRSCPGGAAACSHGWSESSSATRGKECTVSALPRRGRGKERTRTRSVEHVLLFILNSVGTENAEQFRLEVFLLVMLGLARDVLHDGLLLRLAHGEHRVSLLPRKLA